MIIIRVMGGLGNQLQQYALYRKFTSLGIEAKLDTSWFTNQEAFLAKRSLELETFEHLEYEVCTDHEREALIGRADLLGKIKRKLLPGTKKFFAENAIYSPQIFDFRDQYLEGYWACEKYYHDILPDLQQRICFPHKEKSEIAAKKNAETTKRMKQEESCSIHIRRGDYLDPENAAMFGGICTEAYYEAAIRYVKERIPTVHFYLFSDDPVYTAEHYVGEEYSIVDWNTGEDSFYDIDLMSQCRHNVCANSTFSFWGARLNQNLQRKITIRPAKHKNSQEFIPEKMKELWEGWTFVDQAGTIYGKDLV